MSSTPQTLTVKEAAVMLRRSPETVRRWIAEGRLPVTRAGRMLYLQRADVLQIVGITEDARAVIAGTAEPLTPGQLLRVRDAILDALDGLSRAGAI